MFSTIPCRKPVSTLKYSKVKCEKQLLQLTTKVTEVHLYAQTSASNSSIYYKYTATTLSLSM